MAALDLPWHGPAHMALHNAGARAGLAGWRPVAVRPEAGHFVIETDERPVHVASAQRWLHYRWGWQARVARLFRHFDVGGRVALKSGDRVIDIGANVGEFTLGAAARGAEVLAIEGDPTVFECLSLNVADEPLVTALHGLVWKAEEDLTFYSAPAKADSSIFRPSKAQDVRAITQHARPLDALAGDLDRIDLIKCDAEGAEPEVLDGAAEVLKRTRQIALDTGPEREGAETGADCERILAGHGFHVTHSTRGRKITFGIRPGA